MNRGFYRALAKGQQTRFINVQGDRGDIFLRDKDNNLYVLATDINQTLAYLRPTTIKDKEKAVQVVSKILGLDEQVVLEEINQKNETGEVVFLKDNLSTKEIQELKERKLPGLYFEKQRTRFYPGGKLAAQTLGFLGGEGRGHYGIEGFYDDILRGEKGWLLGEINPWGFSLGVLRNEARQGANLVLTLDYNIQQTAERLLKSAVEDLGAEGGEVLVMAPESGKILALAHFPNFDLNRFGEVENQRVFQGGAFQKLFEPGSVFKPFVMAAALEEQKITPETTYLDEGFVQFGRHTIRNFGQRVWGRQTMEGVLEKSINTGAIFAGKQVGDNKFLEYIKRFGFLEPTLIDLQGETWSENRILRQGRPINFATATFGQGVEVTPMQLVRAFAAIANGGKLVRPHIVEKIIKPDGQRAETRQEIQRENIISQQTANQLTTMLVSVLEEGFSRNTKVPGYYIAGKTGTAQVAFSALGIDKPGYSEKTVQSFVGFFPAFEPQFLILVKLNNPQAKTAEFSAAPVFRELTEYIIDYWQIPPDYES